MAGSTRDLPSDVRDMLARATGSSTFAVPGQPVWPKAGIRRLVASGHLTRVAAGHYAAVSAFEALDHWQRHGMRARAFVASCGGDAYLTGWSAVVTLGLPTIGPPPELPLAVRPKAPHRSPQTTPFGRILVSNLPEKHRVRTDRVAVVSRSWAVADVGSGVDTVRQPTGVHRGGRRRRTRGPMPAGRRRAAVHLRPVPSTVAAPRRFLLPP
jgi:hypothetical protein